MSIFPLSKCLNNLQVKQKLTSLFFIGFLMAALSSLFSGAQAQDVPNVLADISNGATATYTTPQGQQELSSNRLVISTSVPLVDPGGDIVGCDGQPLPSYAGFSVSLHEPDASGLGLGPVVPLTTPSAEEAIPPNSANVNPFALFPDEGRYNFLFDSRRTLSSGLNQTEEGATYILVISPPEGSAFGERRVRIELLPPIKNSSDSVVALRYQATALDGQPISVDGATRLTRTVQVDDAEKQSLTFFEFGLDTAICEANQIDITKAADRSAAQPGDIVVYRLNIKNLAKAAVDSVIAYDVPPVGFELLSDSVSAALDSSPIAVTTTTVGNSIRFSTQASVSADQSLDIVYAMRLTPDALRGTGRNDATVTATRTDNGFQIEDGPSSNLITIDPGILADCGTLIGRVFEDKNFDGEQQPGEAGIPNAVIFLDDGNRVVTDADGLFSVQKMLPGQRTGTLDISSLPGYTLAANVRFVERNSHSRLVNLAPGGLVRMNFGVTPTFQEAQN